MADFFNTVKITAPFMNAAVASPVRIQATALNSSTVTTMQVYVDDVLKYQVSGSSLNASVPMSTGKHYVVVQSWDTAGGIHKRGIYVNVQSEAVVVANPAPQSVVPSTSQVSATAGGQSTITKMQLYVDGISKYQSSGSTLSAAVSLASGGHTLSVEASDTSGNLTTTKIPVTSATPSVNILSPATSFFSPMFVSAATIDPTPVIAVQVYIDGTLVYQVSGTGVQATLPISTGKHWVVVQAWNQAGATYKKGMYVTVESVPITISSPKANATVPSPVTITASAPSSSAVQTMQIYIDNSLVYRTSGQTISHSFSLSSGKHYIVAKGWDAGGNNWWTGEYVTVN
jgi:hypothetical protein